MDRVGLKYSLITSGNFIPLPFHCKATSSQDTKCFGLQENEKVPIDTRGIHSAYTSIQTIASSADDTTHRSTHIDNDFHCACGLMRGLVRHACNTLASVSFTWYFCTVFFFFWEREN